MYLVVSLLFERGEEMVRGSREDFSHRQTPFISTMVKVKSRITEYVWVK
jgi:hypothetical protein